MRMCAIMSVISDYHVPPVKKDIYNRTDIKIQLAKKPDISSDILHQLGHSDNPYVRFHVARHKNTAIKTLEKLQNDNNVSVRFYVAKHPNTPQSILKKLMFDKNDNFVRAAAVNHANVPVQDIQELLKTEENPNILMAALCNPHLPKSVKEPYKDYVFYVRYKPNQTINFSPESEQTLNDANEIGRNTKIPVSQIINTTKDV